MPTPTPTTDQRREAAQQAMQSGQKLTRELPLTRDAVNVDARTVQVAFSSDLPYERYWGIEILDHSPTSVRLGRLRDSAAVLVNHDIDQHVGVVEAASIDADHMGRAILRFGKSQEADVLFNDIVDGIRSKVSVGYIIHNMVLEQTGDNGDVYRVTDWEPYEISIVSVPADNTVGVGRSVSTETKPIEQEHKAMPAENPNPTPAAPTVPVITAADRDAELKKLRDGEAARVREINAIAAKFKDRVQGLDDLHRGALNGDTTVDTFRQQVLDSMVESGALRVADKPAIGMSEKEKQRFSFCRAMLYALEPFNKEYEKAAGFELECSAAARQATQSARDGGISVPYDMLVQSIAVDGSAASRIAAMMSQRRSANVIMGGQQRDLVVGTATAGGHTVATDLLGGSFIELLVNQLAVAQVGATMLTDLNGNIAIPRNTSGSTGYWVAENGAPTESQQAFDQVAMTPKTVGAFTDYSRRLLLQSSIDVEQFVRMDLARTVALAIDLAAINGSGTSNQPTGVLNTSGIGSVAGGTNGAAPSWDNMVDLESAVANANAANGSLRYLTNTKVRGKLKRSQMFSGTNGLTIWQAVQDQNAPVAVSNQVPSNLTKGTSSGVCSAIIYGNWLELIIGMWGSLDLLLDPYTGSSAGTKRVVALQDIDINVRHPVSFSAMVDALTT